MSGYVKSWIYETTFDGDRVSVRLRPLSRLRVVQFAALSVDGIAINERVLQFYADAVAESAESFSGLHDAAGAPIAIDVALRDAYFTALVVEIGAELVRRATPVNPTLPGSLHGIASQAVGSEQVTTNVTAD